MSSIFRNVGRLLSRSQLQSVVIAQKVLKVKSRDADIFRTSKINRIDAIAKKLQRSEGEQKSGPGGGVGRFGPKNPSISRYPVARLRSGLITVVSNE